MTVSLTRSAAPSASEAAIQSGERVAVTHVPGPLYQAGDHVQSSASPPGSNQGRTAAASTAAVEGTAGEQAATSLAPDTDAIAGALGSDYQKRLLAHIEPFRRYPDEAGEAGTRGVVQLAFQIDRSGGVKGVWIARSSGSRSLDEAAVATIHRAEPLPPIPTGLPDAMVIQLPVVFSGPG